MRYITTDGEIWTGKRWCGCGAHAKPCELNAYPDAISGDKLGTNKLAKEFPRLHFQEATRNRLFATNCSSFDEVIHPGDWVFRSNQSDESGQRKFLKLDHEAVQALLRQPASESRYATRSISFSDLGIEADGTMHSEIQAVYTDEKFVGITDEYGNPMPHSLAEYFISYFLEGVASLPEWTEQISEAI